MVIQHVVDMTHLWAQTEEYLRCGNTNCGGHDTVVGTNARVFGCGDTTCGDMTQWEAQTEEYLLSGDTNCGGHDTVVGTNGRVFAVW